MKFRTENPRGLTSVRSIRRVAALCAPLALFLCATAQAQPPGPPGETFAAVTFVEGLRNPWSMAFLPNGDMLVTERRGQLRIIRDGQLLPDPVPGVPEVRAQGQGGLQDVVLHPDFESNRLIYLSYAKPNEDGSLGTTGLSRARLEDDRLTDVEEIFEADAWADTPGHFGARIAFDDEGYLFMSVGDRMAGLSMQGMDPDLEGHPSQDNSNHQGTIVRLNDDGSVPGDNPFVVQEGVRPEIWSWGHRNQQALAFHPESGDLWSAEHGPQGGDELNLIRAGANYGWPVIGYGANYVVGTEIHASRGRANMEQPAAFWVPSIGISGLAFYDGDAFPNWRGNAFAGGLSGNYQRLVRISLSGQTVINREPMLVGEYRIRDVRVGPDGLLYIATDNIFGQPSEIIRLEPTDE
ncbi:PQQ-dependent sugar dehydrogenase [Candidatus Rariloculus sp.]|uniref:PQQ-dependent sugar dehydrogenase n=1 Tax=Candidatus Rariloculus sp. TaxID=3101265 RepID=UPI003D13692F